MQLLSNRTAWCCSALEAASSPTMLTVMPEGKNNTLSTLKAETRSSSPAEQTDVLDRQQNKVFENRTHLANPLHWSTLTAYITTIPSPNLSSHLFLRSASSAFQLTRYVLLYPFANHPTVFFLIRNLHDVYIHQKHLCLRPQERLRPHNPKHLISYTKRLYYFETGRHQRTLQVP